MKTVSHTDLELGNIVIPTFSDKTRTILNDQSYVIVWIDYKNFTFGISNGRKGATHRIIRFEELHKFKVIQTQFSICDKVILKPNLSYLRLSGDITYEVLKTGPCKGNNYSMTKILLKNSMGRNEWYSEDSFVLVDHNNGSEIWNGFEAHEKKAQKKLKKKDTVPDQFNVAIAAMLDSMLILLEASEFTLAEHCKLPFRPSRVASVLSDADFHPQDNKHEFLNDDGIQVIVESDGVGSSITMRSASIEHQLHRLLGETVIAVSKQGTTAHAFSISGVLYKNHSDDHDYIAAYKVLDSSSRVWFNLANVGGIAGKTIYLKPA